MFWFVLFVLVLFSFGTTSRVAVTFAVDFAVDCQQIAALLSAAGCDADTMCSHIMLTLYENNNADAGLCGRGCDAGSEASLFALGNSVNLLWGTVFSRFGEQRSPAACFFGCYSVELLLQIHKL
jgi:hypothetical protein